MGQSIEFEGYILKDRWFFFDDRIVVLKPRETDLMAYFLQHPNEMLLPSKIEKAIWGLTTTCNTKVWLGQLRRRIEDNPSDPRLLRTIGRGRETAYIFVTDPRKAAALDAVYDGLGRLRRNED